MTDINKFINGTYKRDDRDKGYNSGLKLMLKIGKILSVVLILSIICVVIAMYVNDNNEAYKVTEVPTGWYDVPLNEEKKEVFITHIDHSHMAVSILSDNLTVNGHFNEIIINTNVSSITFTGIDNIVFILPGDKPTIIDKGHNNKIIEMIY